MIDPVAWMWGSVRSLHTMKRKDYKQYIITELGALLATLDKVFYRGNPRSILLQTGRNRPLLTAYVSWEEAEELERQVRVKRGGCCGCFWGRGTRLSSTLQLYLQAEVKKRDSLEEFDYKSPSPLMQEFLPTAASSTMQSISEPVRPEELSSMLRFLLITIIHLLQRPVFYHRPGFTYHIIQNYGDMEMEKLAYELTMRFLSVLPTATGSGRPEEQVSSNPFSPRINKALIQSCARFFMQQVQSQILEILNDLYREIQRIQTHRLSDDIQSVQEIFIARCQIFMERWRAQTLGDPRSMHERVNMLASYIQQQQQLHQRKRQQRKDDQKQQRRRQQHRNEVLREEQLRLEQQMKDQNRQERQKKDQFRRMCLRQEKERKEDERQEKKQNQEIKDNQRLEQIRRDEKKRELTRRDEDKREEMRQELSRHEEKRRERQRQQSQRQSDPQRLEDRRRLERSGPRRADKTHMKRYHRDQ